MSSRVNKTFGIYLFRISAFHEQSMVQYIQRYDEFRDAAYEFNLFIYLHNFKLVFFYSRDTEIEPPIVMVEVFRLIVLFSKQSLIQLSTCSTSKFGGMKSTKGG